MERYPVMTAAAGSPAGDSQNSLATSPPGPVLVKEARACGTFTVTRVS